MVLMAKAIQTKARSVLYVEHCPRTDPASTVCQLGTRWGGTCGWLTIPGQHAVVVLVSGPDGVRDGSSEPNAPEGKGNSGLYGVGNDLATEAISSGDVNKLVDDRQTGDDDVEGEYAAVVAEGSVLI